jgi:hypothetical protein
MTNQKAVKTVMFGALGDFRISLFNLSICDESLSGFFSSLVYSKWRRLQINVEIFLNWDSIWIINIIF